MNKKVIASLVLLQGLLLGTLSSSFAAGVAVYPLRIELDSQKSQGNFISKSVTVENFSNKTIRIKANTQSWKLDAEGNLIYLEKPDEHSLIDRTRFNPSEFDIGPNQKQLVRFTVKVPDGPDGEYREILFFNTIAEKKNVISNLNKNLSININFETRFGVTIYLYKGITARNAIITDLSIEKERKETYLTAMIKNEGNIHTALNGKLILTNQSNAQNNMEIPIKYFLMPECTQKMKIKIPDKFTQNKNNSAKISLDYYDRDMKFKNIAAEADFGGINIEVPVNNISASKAEKIDINKTKMIPTLEKKINKQF